MGLGLAGSEWLRVACRCGGLLLDGDVWGCTGGVHWVCVLVSSMKPRVERKRSI